MCVSVCVCAFLVCVCAQVSLYAHSYKFVFVTLMYPSSLSILSSNQTIYRCMRTAEREKKTFRKGKTTQNVHILLRNERFLSVKLHLAFHPNTLAGRPLSVLRSLSEGLGNSPRKETRKETNKLFLLMLVMLF